MINWGEYKIIRTDGTEQTVKERPTLKAIQKAIGCDTIDTVILGKRPTIVMVVDDIGMLQRKPVNAKATEMVRRVFGEHYPYSIHGDVAIVHDGDFAS